MSLSGHKGFRKSIFLKCSNWALRGQRLSLKMFQLSWKLMEMILTIFWTSLRYLGIDSRALRGTIGRLFSFLWLYNQPFYMPPNLPRALRKGAVSSFFLLSSHNLLLLPHASCDFDQTWSEWPVGEWLQKLSTVWPQRSCRGHRGQKGHFYGKCYSSYMLNWILTKFGQKHQWVSGYKSYQQFDLKGHVEVTGVKKVIYFSKCSDWAEILIQWSLWHSKHPKNILKFIRGH